MYFTHFFPFKKCFLSSALCSLIWPFSVILLPIISFSDFISCKRLYGASLTPSQYAYIYFLNRLIYKQHRLGNLLYISFFLSIKFWVKTFCHCQYNRSASKTNTSHLMQCSCFRCYVSSTNIPFINISMPSDIWPFDFRWCFSVRNLDCFYDAG